MNVEIRGAVRGGHQERVPMVNLPGVNILINNTRYAKGISGLYCSSLPHINVEKVKQKLLLCKMQRNRMGVFDCLFIFC